MKSRLAYIDDDVTNLDCIKLIFKTNFEVETFSEPEHFLEHLNSNITFSAIMIDVHMPKMDGFELYDKINESPFYNGCPIIFISGDDSEEIIIKSLSLNVVDILSRHMGPEEMMARVNSKIQFFKNLRNIIEFGNMRVNLTLLKCYIDAREIPLTFIEFKILCQIITIHPELVDKKQITEYVWGTGTVLDATIYTHVSNLNGKLLHWDFEVIGIKNRGFKIVPRGSLL